MKSLPVDFTSAQGHQLHGIIDSPDQQESTTYALFAHCFTCSKDLKASATVSRALAREGYTVLRFDFTGLGESHGEFGETTFASNLEDLIAAADYLNENHHPPQLLIGHSLGGAAAIHAAAKIPSLKAVATIGAPYDPEHVTHLLTDDLETIREHGQATVNIGGRPFQIKRKFLESLQRENLSETVRTMKRALLVLHSPIDAIVGIDNAANLFQAAKHPKSFISLDNADHLLSRKQDAQYAGRLIAAWTAKYVDPQ